MRERALGLGKSFVGFIPCPVFFSIGLVRTLLQATPRHLEIAASFEVRHQISNPT